MAMQAHVTIDYLPESARSYRSGWAIVVVDVTRPTTTVAAELSDPLLVGEWSVGVLPASFDVDNSLAEFAERRDIHRPLVLVSSSDTSVIHEASECEAVGLSCFRNHSVLACHLAGYECVAVIGAGSKGEFREEDQICGAWIAAALIEYGYAPGTGQSSDVVRRCRDAPANACFCRPSVDFLKRTGRFRDLAFILGHVDDLSQILQVRNREVKTDPAGARTHQRSQLARSCV